MPVCSFDRITIAASRNVRLGIMEQGSRGIATYRSIQIFGSHMQNFLPVTDNQLAHAAHLRRKSRSILPGARDSDKSSKQSDAECLLRLAK